MVLFSKRLFVSELQRILSRARVWIGAGVFLAIGFANVYRMRDGLQGQQSWWEVLKYALSPVEVLLPLVVAGAVGTLMADDRRSGFASLILARSVRPLAYLLSGLAASMAAAAAMVAIPLALVGSLARAVAPAVGTVSSFGTVSAPTPPGFPRSPLLVLLSPAVMFATAAVFVVAVAAVTGLLTTNVLAVVAVPGLLFLVASSLPNRLSAGAPATFMEMRAGGPTLLGVLGFWAGGTLAALAISVAVIVRRRGL